MLKVFERPVIHYKNLLVELKGKNNFYRKMIMSKIFKHRSLAQALTTLSTQTSKENDAHAAIASALLNDISIPMRNLAEAQNKDRKSVNEKRFVLI
jgi:hypothetical protein